MVLSVELTEFEISTLIETLESWGPVEISRLRSESEDEFIVPI